MKTEAERIGLRNDSTPRKLEVGFVPDDGEGSVTAGGQRYAIPATKEDYEAWSVLNQEHMESNYDKVYLWPETYCKIRQLMMREDGPANRESIQEAISEMVRVYDLWLNGEVPVLVDLTVEDER